LGKRCEDRQQCIIIDQKEKVLERLGDDQGGFGCHGGREFHLSKAAGQERRKDRLDSVTEGLETGESCDFSRSSYLAGSKRGLLKKGSRRRESDCRD